MYGIPSMVGVVLSYTVEYNAAGVVWCGMQNQNIKTCRRKFRGQTLTSTGMSGSFNPPPSLHRVLGVLHRVLGTSTGMSASFKPPPPNGLPPS